MKKLFIAILLVFALFIGCNQNCESTTDNNVSTRFTIEYIEVVKTGNTLATVRIITDTETDIQYLWVASSYKSGLTRLETE